MNFMEHVLTAVSAGPVRRNCIPEVLTCTEMQKALQFNFSHVEFCTALPYLI